MQVQPGLSAMGALRSAVAAEGPFGLYKGMGAPLATVAAFNAVLFSSRGAVERLLSPDGAPGRCGARFSRMPHIFCRHSKAACHLPKPYAQAPRSPRGRP